MVNQGLILPPSVQAKVSHAKMPLKYDEAINALIACRSIDEAKYYSNRADALAAWAKIYKDDLALAESRRLKIYAYERMGALARELQPGGLKNMKGLPIDSKERGSKPGPRALLVEAGLSRGAAQKALAISRAPRKQLDQAIDKGYGVSRVAAQFLGLGRTTGPIRSASWKWLTDSTHGNGPMLFRVRTALKSKSAKQVASDLDVGEVQACRKILTGIMEWLDEFEQYMPKSDGV